MKLYANKFSPNCKRVRVMAHELNIPMDTVEIDFAKGEHKTPEYLAKNPMGKVPTFQDDNGWTLWESPAICTYLATKHKNPNLMPTDPNGMAEMTRWMFWNASHFEPAVFGVAFEKVWKAALGMGTPDTTKVEMHTKDFDRYAPIFNAYLEGKTWICGNTYTIADIVLGTTCEVSMNAGTGLDYTRFPHIKNWYGRLTTRDAWKKCG